MKKKVLLAAHVGAPWGGVSTRYSALLNSSLSERVELFFFETTFKNKSFIGSGSLSIKNILYSTIIILKFFGELIRNQPEIVHIASAHKGSFVKNSILILFARMLRKKVIIAPHCSIKVFLPDGKSLYKKYVLWVLKKCKGMIVLSSEWLELKKVLKNTQIIYLPNSINLDSYKNIKRTSLKSGQKKLIILYLGHIGRQKGIFDLVDSLKFIDATIKNKYEVHLYGETQGKYEVDELLKKVNDLNLEDTIMLFPPVFDDEKIEVYKQADIFILPSHHEGMPISIIEAMAAGLPVIATEVGGIPDLIEPEVNGLLVPVASPMKLSEAIVKLIEKPDLRLKLGMMGRKIALENHEIEKYVSKLVCFYKEISLNE